jgi:hypothetical protein
VGEESGDEDNDDGGDGREAAAAAAAAATTTAPEDDCRSNTTLLLPLLDHDGNASTSCVQVDASGGSGAHDQDRLYEVLSGDDSGVEEVGWSSYVPPSARHTGENLVSDHEVRTMFINSLSFAHAFLSFCRLIVFLLYLNIRLHVG